MIYYKRDYAHDFHNFNINHMASICEWSYLTTTTTINHKEKRLVFQQTSTNLIWKQCYGCECAFWKNQVKWHSRRNMRAYEIIFQLSVLMHFVSVVVFSVQFFYRWIKSTFKVEQTTNAHQWSLLMLNINMTDYNNYVHVSSYDETRRG